MPHDKQRQDTDSQHRDQDRDQEQQERPKQRSEDPKATDDFAVRRHTLPTGLNYTTTAGRMVLRREETKDGKSEGFRPKAEIFLVAYTADPPAPEASGPSRRPVVFAFNGGPGSSSVWLHMGLLGPRMVDSGDVGALTPPPFGLVDNPETILQHADLVMIDPVNTGFSRVVDGNEAGEFHGFEEEIGRASCRERVF